MNDVIFIMSIFIVLLLLGGFYLYATNTVTVPPDPDNPDFNWTDPLYPVNVIDEGGNGGGGENIEDIILPTTGNFQYSYNQYQIPDFADYDFVTFGDNKYHWRSGADGLNNICQFFINSMGYFTQNPNDSEFSRALCDFIEEFYDTVIEHENLLDNDYTPYYKNVPMLLSYVITSTATPPKTKQVIKYFLEDLLTTDDSILLTPIPQEFLPYTLLALLMKNYILNGTVLAEELSPHINSFIGCNITNDLTADNGVFRDGGIRKNGVPYFKEAKIQLDILIESTKFFDLSDTIFNSTPFLFLDKLFGRLLHPTYPYSNVRILHDNNSFLGNGTYVSQQSTNVCEIIPSVGFYRIHAEKFVLQGFMPKSQHPALADIKAGQYCEYQFWPKVLKLENEYLEQYPEDVYFPIEGLLPMHDFYYPPPGIMYGDEDKYPRMACWGSGLLIIWEGDVLMAKIKSYGLFYHDGIFNIAYDFKMNHYINNIGSTSEWTIFLKYDDGEYSRGFSEHKVPYSESLSKPSPESVVSACEEGTTLRHFIKVIGICKVYADIPIGYPDNYSYAGNNDYAFNSEFNTYIKPL